MRWIWLALVLVLCPVAKAQCTLINSVTTGSSLNWSSTSTWTGGVVPTGGNCVTINAGVVINQTLGSTGSGMGWIRVQHSGASLTVGGNCLTSQCTVYFGSTGTNPIGSGALRNPGADATMYGFFVAQGTLNLTTNSTYPLIVTSSNGTSPIYALDYVYGNYTGCTTITSNVCNGSSSSQTANVTFDYDNFGPAVGVTGSTGYQGVYFDYSSGSTLVFTIENCEFSALNQVYVASSGKNLNISSNFFNGTTNGVTITAPASSSSDTNWTIENNTESGATTDGTFFSTANWIPAVVFSGNAEEGTSTVTRGLWLNGYFGTGDAGNSFTGNFCYNPLDNTNLGTNPCYQYYGAGTDTTTVFTNNVIVGGYQGIAGYYGSPTVSGNWMQAHSDSAGGQGIIIVYGQNSQTVSNVWTLHNNVYALDSDNSNTLALFFTGSASSTYWNSFLIKNETVVGTGSSTGFSMAEGSTSTTEAIQNSYLRNSLFTGGALSVFDSNANSTWNTTGDYDSSAVHHNLTYSVTTAYEKNATTLGCGGSYAGWSGTSTVGFINCTSGPLHPSANYGDLTVNPRMINTSANPSSFAAWCGATNIAGLFANLSYQSGFGGTYNPNCSIANMNAWLKWNFTPMNGLLKNAGYSGDCPNCDIGAVPVYPATAMVIE